MSFDNRFRFPGTHQGELRRPPAELFVVEVQRLEDRPRDRSAPRRPKTTTQAIYRELLQDCRHRLILCAVAPLTARLFHGKLDGETNSRCFTGNLTVKQQISPFDEGFLVGVLVGEGHFGGDGRQPQITLRMHTDHEALFRWIEAHFPGGKLYGPYHHGGRSYFQWMARGSFLRTELLPLLERHLVPELDRKTYARFQAMKKRYRL